MPFIGVDENALLTVPYSATGTAAINCATYNLGNKAYEVGLASFYIYVTGGSSPPATIAITHKYQLDAAGSYFGVSGTILNDSSVNTLALSASTTAVFEARMNTQSWWKFNAFGGRIIITPSGTGDYTINLVKVCAI